MYALILDVAAGLLRHLLTGAAAWLITNGIATKDQVDQLIAGLALALVSAGLLIYKKYKDRILVNTLAGKSEVTTVQDAKADIKAGLGASALTPSDQIPAVPATAESAISPSTLRSFDSRKDQ